MAERENLTVDWDRYLDQSIDLIDMARKVTFLEADKRVLAEENNKLKRELYDFITKYDQAIAENKENAEALYNIDRLLERKCKELIDARGEIEKQSRWIKAQKKQIQELKKSKNHTEAVEGCPHCMTENVYPNYDVVGNNYTAVCKNCGEEIMLCDECFHADDNREHKCDWTEKDGCFRKEGR